MLTVAIVGAGRNGTALLRALVDVPRVRVIGITDHNLEAPGLELARKLKIPVSADPLAFVQGPTPPDLVVQATGDAAVHELLSGAKGPETQVVDAAALRLVMSLVIEEEKLLKELERHSRELEVIINSTHDAMIAVDRKGAVTLFNAAAERVIGLTRAEVIGRAAQDVIPNTRLHLILTTGVAELNQQQEVGATTILTSRVPLRDAADRVVGALAVFRDIGEMKNLAGEITNLREIQSLLQAIINSTQDAISVVDAEGKGLIINPAYTRLTGLTQGDVIGKPATVDIAEGESMHMQVLKTRRPVRNVRMKVGPKRKDVIVNVAPIMVGAELKGSVGVIHDTSEIMLLTEELERARTLIRRLEAKYTFDDIVGTSPSIVAAIDQARRAAETPVTVLLRGESGTGKELFAHAIHGASRRKGGQFIRVNCAALSESLLESELFGYVEGAFTGAKRGGRRGLFEEANGGTVFLDEIGEISQNLQAKLLRVLQEREIIRVGDNRPVPVDVRIIAATNLNLELAMERGTFREDLYYRLNVIPLFIPPLRHRREDLPALALHTIRRLNQEYGRAVEAIDEQTMDILSEYHWPGNIRELENVLSRAMINMRFSETELRAEHLPPLGVRANVQSDATESEGSYYNRTLDEIMAEKEREVLQAVLRQCNGNKTEAARRLDIATRSLYYKLERLGMEQPR